MYKLYVPFTFACSSNIEFVGVRAPFVLHCHSRFYFILVGDRSTYAAIYAYAVGFYVVFCDDPFYLHVGKCLHIVFHLNASSVGTFILNSLVKMKSKQQN